MAINAEVFKRALEGVEASIGSASAKVFDGEVENLVTLVVEAVAFGNSAALKSTQALFEKVYSRAKMQASERASASERIGQLRALATLSAVGSRMSRAQDLNKIAQSNDKILRVLLASNQAMDNQAIAKQTGYSEATVARAMPELRASGMVESVRDWRRLVNRLTASGRIKAEGLRVAFDAERESRHNVQLKKGPVRLHESVRGRYASAREISGTTVPGANDDRTNIFDPKLLASSFPDTSFSEFQKRRSVSFTLSMGDIK